MKNRILLLCLLGFTLLRNASAQSPAATAETQYLVFQAWPAQLAYPGIPPLPGKLSLSQEQMAGFAQSLIKAIGATGDARHKLGFAVGPFSFDVPDDETRQWIRDAFAVARENDVAVAIHIDDSMSWGNRKDLLANPDNIETADWKQIPNQARSLQWGVNPTKYPPQMCYNAPEIVAAARARAKLIGAEIARGLADLKSQGKEHLFAGVIAGSETQISPEFGTNRRLGFRALAHRGFSKSHPPKDLDAERVSVVKEWIELWCNSLREGGAPRGKIFCHIAFTDQGLRKADAKESYAEKVHFAPPEVAFSTAYRPGFSAYPEGATFQEIHAAVAAHGSPGWISAEGTNVSPTSMPGEPTMETYLGRIFNHGGVLANVFSWGIGGEAQRDKNFFRQATENSQALAGYAKFLRGEKLVEVGQGFSEAFPEKMKRIQTELPGWAQKTGRQTEAMALMQKIPALARERRWQEADKAADELLALMTGAPTPTKAGTPTTQPPPSSARSDDTVKRLTEKVERVKAGARKWAESGRDPSPIAHAMQEKFKPLMEAGKIAEAEAELDRVLAQLTEETTSTAPPPVSTETVHQRVAAKIERIQQGAQKLAEGGGDPSPILKTMKEKVGPLLDTGKFIEAEPELDRVLKLLTPDVPPAPGNPKEERQAPSPETAASLEQVATGLRLAEGPVWDGENLIFADVFPSKIHKLGSDGKVSTIRSETRKGAGMALDSKGRLLICEVDGFRVTRIEKDGTEKTLAESYEGKKLNGPNDLVVDAKDGIYFTDPLFLNKDKREQDKDAVYYIGPAGKVLRVADDLEKPNGIALARDGQTLFVADTVKSKLRAYPVKEDGTLGEGRDFGSVPAPDGVRVDLDGKVYAAGKTGIAVWDAAGKALGTLKTPAPPNSLAFGGADRRTMFITTNASVFKIRLDQVIKVLTSDEPTAPQAPPPPATSEIVQQRIAAKIARIKEGVQKLAAGGSDPSAILKTMQEKVGPLLDAGKVIEAEPELDRVLEQIKQTAK